MTQKRGYIDKAKTEPAKRKRYSSNFKTTVLARLLLQQPESSP